MSRSQTGQAPARSASDRLDSWKEIAAYLNRDISTLRRWEEKEGLPVRRERRKSKVIIYAYKSELDAWLRECHPEAQVAPDEIAVSHTPSEPTHFDAPTPSDFTAVNWSEPEPELQQEEVVPTLAISPATHHDTPHPVQFERSTRLIWIDRAVAVIVVLLLASVATFAYQRWRLSGGGSEQRPIGSLAVLPLKDFSPEVQGEHFADGFAEMLIADLAQIRDLQVISGASMARYKTARKPLQQLARDLKVDAVIEGYVERNGDRVRFTARFFDTRSRTRVSGLTYERNAAELQRVSAESARAIASHLQSEFTPAQQLRVAHPAAMDPAAFDAYFKGQYNWKQLSCDGFQQAVQDFQQALAVAPNYAPAHARLANTYFKMAEFGCESHRAVIPRARAAAARALALDHNLAEAHAVLGMISFLYDWDWQTAQSELKRATELNPSDALAHSWYGTFLFATGRNAEAFAEFKKARDVDPAPGVSTLVYAYTLYHARRYDEAIGHFQRVLEAHPNSVPAYFGMAACYERKRMRGKALKNYMKAKELSGVDPETILTLRSASWKGGLKEFWRKELELASAHARGDTCWSALSAAHVGDPAQMLGLLEKAYNARCSALTSLKVDPLYDKLRQEPRFQRIIQRMGLPVSKPPSRRRSSAKAASAKKTQA